MVDHDRLGWTDFFRAALAALECGHMDSLTNRQRDVCGLLVLGWNNKEIAGKLNISRRTVEDHRNDIYKRMHVRNVVELVRKVLLPEEGMRN